MPQQVWAIGDIHGDHDAAVGFLQRIGIIDDNMRYVRQGDGKTIVFVGDIIDGYRTSPIPNETDDLHVLMYLMGMSERVQHPDRILLLAGNHELMNFSDDFRYVLTDDLDERKRQFTRGTGSMVAQVTRFLPSLRLEHGILFSHASVNLDTINAGWGEELRGMELVDAINKTWREFLTCSEEKQCSPISPELFDIFWSRTNVDKTCTKVQAVLARFGATKMVCGHMPAKRIRERCSRTLFLVDAMASSAFGNEGGDSLIRLQ
jgi:hypothetical protein